MIASEKARSIYRFPRELPIKNNMEGLIDYVILGTTVACSFGTAFLVQKVTLGLILKAMDQKRLS